jgi:hypothetical protein
MTQRYSRRSSRSNSSAAASGFTKPPSDIAQPERSQPDPADAQRSGIDRPRISAYRSAAAKSLDTDDINLRGGDSGSRSGYRSQRYAGDSRSRLGARPTHTNLVRLIEQDAPLHNRSHLVLMYGPFQAEMSPEAGQGVATWIKGCLRQHGIPSLVRFDDRRYAQVFRRDQFQPWVAHLIEA